MCLHRTLPALLLGLAACTAFAQSQGGMRWPGGSQGALGLQAGSAALRVPCGSFAMPCANTTAVVGKATLADDIGVYGRLGTASRPPSLWRFGTPAGTGLTYGVGLSWDFSARGSATLGWDSYDFRSATGERDLRATSLGLQWRY